MRHNTPLSLLLAGLTLLGPTTGSMAADPARINWETIPTTTVPLFYPGQSSYEWVRSSEHKGAVKEVLRGDSCTFCHDEPDGEKDMGEKLVQAGRLEPTPVKGKEGFIPLKIQAAFDSKNIHLRFQWKTSSPRPGTEHQYLRFDGKSWQVYGSSALDPSMREGRQPGIHEDGLSMMIDDGKVPGFANQGCWLTCHDGMPNLQKQASREEIAKNALLAAIKKDSLRKYLPATRKEPSDWRSGKPLDDIAKLKANGEFLDLLHWRAARTYPLDTVEDGYVLEWRHTDSGAELYESNHDPKLNAPRFMWDQGKAGFRSITAKQLHKKNHFLIREQNAVKFNPKAGWKEGDMIPLYVLGRQPLNESAGKGRATASWENGTWTVLIVRPLGLEGIEDKPLSAGKTYNVGFAVHDGNIGGRGHHVSYVKTLGLDAKPAADINAVRLP